MYINLLTSQELLRLVTFAKGCGLESSLWKFLCVCRSRVRSRSQKMSWRLVTSAKGCGLTAVCASLAQPLSLAHRCATRRGLGGGSSHSVSDSPISADMKPSMLWCVCSMNEIASKPRSSASFAVVFGKLSLLTTTCA